MKVCKQPYRVLTVTPALTFLDPSLVKTALNNAEGVF